MIRVLQIVNDMHRAGLETMLMNYYRNINRQEIQFDFLTHRSYKSDYEDEIKSLGGNVYHAPRLYPQNYVKYFSYMKNFFDKHSEYKIVHSHIDSMSFLPLLAAKKANIPIRIAHSHNISIDKDYKYLLKEFFRFNIDNVANYYCACGQAAGIFLFRGKKFKIIPNAVKANNFAFDFKVRSEVRKKLLLDENQFIVGNVGRLSKQKNQDFLIEIFKYIHKYKKNSKLIIVGIGNREKKLRKKVFDSNLGDSVLFLGNRSDVSSLYQAFDVLLMPSFYEGVPVVGIEAQFSNLPVFFSTNVPKEVDFTHQVKFISLNKSAEYWCNKIVNLKTKNRSHYDKKIFSSEYNIDTSYKEIEQFYKELYRSKDSKCQ